jgi:hypothetical protein
MEILLWVLGIHVTELAGILIFFLLRRNKILENTISKQQQYLDTIDIVLSRLDDSLGQIDERMWVEGDEELQSIFTQVKEIKSIISSISNK